MLYNIKHRLPNNNVNNTSPIRPVMFSHIETWITTRLQIVSFSEMKS